MLRSSKSKDPLALKIFHVDFYLFHTRRSRSSKKKTHDSFPLSRRDPSYYVFILPCLFLPFFLSFFILKDAGEVLPYIKNFDYYREFFQKFRMRYQIVIFLMINMSNTRRYSQ